MDVFCKLCVGGRCPSIGMGMVDSLPSDNMKDCRGVPSKVGAMIIQDIATPPSSAPSVL